MNDEMSHLRDLAKKYQEQIKELELQLRVRKDAIESTLKYLTFISDNDQLTKSEKALIEMVLNYLRG